ncbi:MULTISPECIES: hypothetical protein [unclassified Rhizobium]|uniref:hypothetical protein n=1 Tax=unclassified Rhizobium TaxID=2613769 RepID=UPI0013AECC88|nr:MULTISPECIES: hypothetical protein [unclassified Rhizobium]MBB3288841.1 hypothetical protein [Rhizobium sp. BK252]MBB3403583.1 hypothetical protein [Rhizobium sp. BK289]MBB3416232.1 hypothetical protein [Rhizobium sp. BK284]MBB3484046.1 hypothetical protein [Rhizobium sp. BK347]MDK4720289.1 hypothetical protein [Rhizobium sp. CNPSo 3968]
MANDRSHDPQDGNEEKQALAKIQHSKAHDSVRVSKNRDKAKVVADPRNRLADGKVDPATRELKPKTE